MKVLNRNNQPIARAAGPLWQRRPARRLRQNNTDFLLLAPSAWKFNALPLLLLLLRRRRELRQRTNEMMMMMMTINSQRFSFKPVAFH